MYLDQLDKEDKTQREEKKNNYTKQYTIKWRTKAITKNRLAAEMNAKHNINTNLQSCNNFLGFSFSFVRI